MEKSKIDFLCEYLEQNTAKQYPIANAELAESSDYIKNGYLKMLAVVMQQSGNILKTQLEVFRRIVEGAKVENAAEDYLRMALDIEIEDYINFCLECKELKLKYRWVLDAIIITCVQEKIEGQLALIAHFCESYEVSKEELRYIAAMAKAILCMNESDYITTYEIKEDTVPDVIFSDYMYLMPKSCLCSNANITIFRPTCQEDVTVQALEKINEIDTPCIKIIGVEILNNYNLEFCNREKVVLEDCRFTGGENPIRFLDCEHVIIQNCKFAEFTTRTIYIEDISDILIDGCEFSNCMVRYCRYNGSDWESLGGVIYSNEPESIKRLNLMDSKFISCGGINESYRYASEIISNKRCYVCNCQFDNCWNFHKYDEKDPEGRQRTMFPEGSAAENCNFENSAAFCETIRIEGENKKYFGFL